MKSRLRLETGLELLDSWASAAEQVDRNAVYRALFAIAETHQVLDDRRPHEFSVLVRKDLVLELRVHAPDSFGIRYIGPARPRNSGDAAPLGLAGP